MSRTRGGDTAPQSAGMAVTGLLTALVLVVTGCASATAGSGVAAVTGPPGAGDGTTGGSAAGTVTAIASIGTTTSSAGPESTATATTTADTCPPAPVLDIVTSASTGGEQDWDEPTLTVTWTTNGWGVQVTVSGPTTIAVYPNGTVLAMIRSGTSTPSLGRVLRGSLDTCRLSALVAGADEVMGSDFGNPSITDQGMTLVSYRGRDGTESSLSVYALGIGDEYVTDEQRSARTKLHGLLAGVRSAGEAAQQEYRPDRLMLRVVDTDSDTLRRLTWPGSLGSLGGAHGPDCVAVRGDDAAAVREALGDGPTLVRWSDGDRSVVLRAFVLLPGAVACR